NGRVGSGSYVTRLQIAPALQPADGETLPPASRYAERARRLRNRGIAGMHHGLRYDLLYGDPVTNPALNAAWGRELARAAAYSSLKVTSSWGLPALRPENLLIVTGTQQAYALCARALLDEGDTVVLEEPHYFGAHHVLAAHGANFLPVRTDDDGLVCSDLPDVPPKLISVTPSHQFPTGAVMSLPRRLELLRYAAS